MSISKAFHSVKVFMFDTMQVNNIAFFVNFAVINSFQAISEMTLHREPLKSVFQWSQYCTRACFCPFIMESVTLNMYLPISTTRLDLMTFLHCAGPMTCCMHK